MSTAEISEVAFPIVILGEAVCATVRVERMASLDHQERFAVGHQRAEAIDILSDARSDEPADRRLDGVMVRFSRRDFSGASYGLALALADKRARGHAPGGRIIATGRVLCGGRGIIGAIDGFDAKAALVLDSISSEDAEPLLFAFPKVNLDAAAPALVARLELAANEHRIELRGVERLDELADLWTAPASPVPRRRGGVPAKLLVAASALICATGGLGLWRYTAGEPIRRCERALTVLDSDDVRSPGTTARGAQITAAVEACSAAATAQPLSGRAQFLAGQAHALNGGKRLASAYWSRAASAGDRDGLAAHGRDLWLNGPATPEVIHEALVFLGRAADKGSPAALEDMAEIYRDGIGVAPDRGRAQVLLKRAESLRGERSR